MEGRAAMAMSRSDSDLAAIYDAMACGVVVRNAAGSVVFANAAAKRIFGRAPDELEGAESPGEDRRIREDGTTMPDDEVPNVAAQARGEPIRNVMMGMVRSDGYVRWLLVDAVPIKDSFQGCLRLPLESMPCPTEQQECQTVADNRAGGPGKLRGLDIRRMQGPGHHEEPKAGRQHAAKCYAHRGRNGLREKLSA